MRDAAKWSLIGAVLLGMEITASADEVDFKNGDKLTGRIESLESGKLTISTAMAGKLVLDMKNVKTFATDKPIAMQMDTGRKISQQVKPGIKEGEVIIVPAGAGAVEAIPLAHVKYINFNHDWHGAVTVGGSLFRGNTTSETLNITANAVRRTENDRITADAGYLYAREHSPGQSERETANNGWIGGKYDYFFSPKFYSYTNVRLERDLLADIDLRLTPGLGVGYQWIDKPDFHFSTEAGVSYLYRKYSHDGTDESVALRAAYHVDKKLNAHLSLQHNLEYFPGLDSIENFYFNTVIGLRASITDHMFTEFKTLYKYDAQPAPGKGRSDTQFILGVGWSF